jgi:hypothetical protein
MHVYTYGEKAKARKSGPSLLGKAKALGKDARVFSFWVYWDPTHHCWRYSVHVPDGEELLNLMSTQISQRWNQLTLAQ